MAQPPFLRKHLSPDVLSWRIYRLFQNVLHQGGENSTALAAALMSGFAMFSLKDPSLLAFDQRREQDANNHQFVYHIQKVPCDTRMREIRPSGLMRREAAALPSLSYSTGYSPAVLVQSRNSIQRLEHEIAVEGVVSFRRPRRVCRPLLDLPGPS